MSQKKAGLKNKCFYWLGNLGAIFETHYAMSSILQLFNYETSAGFTNTSLIMPLNKLVILL